ncbi:MAG: amidophosphoribosyltransferase [Candidatus Nanoarchaeia archaeon]|nr:amidophosphoribosyltransferase [Candidatus Nanoarchaeia archaeon]
MKENTNQFLDDELHEECGVIGIVSKENNVFAPIYQGLQGLQHRGELGCGMATSYENKINCYKEIGLVNDVLQPKYLVQLKGMSGIGHTRYATSSVEDLEKRENAIKKLHPMIGELNENSSFAVVFNGNLTNYNCLRKQLNDFNFETSTDTEVIKNLIIKNYGKENTLESSLKLSYRLMQGAYNITVLDNLGNIYFLKDGHGFKPASLGVLENNKGYIVASETRAFDFAKAIAKRDIGAGELLTITNDLKLNSYQLPIKEKSLCIFEYVYFASIDSIIEGITVNDARVRLGKQLLKEQPLRFSRWEKEKWRIVGVPDSGMPAATAYSNESGIKIRIGLVRNRYYTKRTFINGNEEDRENAALLNSEKYNVIKSAVEGKNIILIDDSIVRGNTMQKTIKRLREKGGAKSVHVKSTFPEIRYPCYMGVDFPTHKELIAYNKTLEQICKEIGADSLQYISTEGLLRAVRRIPFYKKINSDMGYCLACVNNHYSCPVEDELKLD